MRMPPAPSKHLAPRRLFVPTANARGVLSGVLIALLSSVVLSGCGPNFRVEPLVGEDPAVLQILGVSDTDLEVPETVASVERFYRALWTSQASVMWAMLSRDTRASLDQLGLLLDTTGRSLIASRMFPRPDGNGTVKVSLAALFLVRRPIRFTEEATPGPGDDTAVVIARNRLGNQRRVTLRRERGTWVIHHTNFDELPPTVDLSPKLLPSDRVKPTEPTEPTPPAEPAEPAEPVEPANGDEPGTPDIDPEPTDPEPTEPTEPRRNPDLDF